MRSPVPFLAVAAIAALVTAMGCARKPYAISDGDGARFADRLIVVPVASAAPMILGVSDCKVYKAVTKDEQIVDWKTVLDANQGASYPRFMTACTHQAIGYKAPYASVELCLQAIGAGGGCAGGGGSYRSRDGERWQPH